MPFQEVPGTSSGARLRQSAATTGISTRSPACDGSNLPSWSDSRRERSPALPHPLGGDQFRDLRHGAGISRALRPRRFFIPPSLSSLALKGSAVPRRGILGDRERFLFRRSVGRRPPPITLVLNYRGSRSPSGFSGRPPIILLLPPINPGAGTRGKRPGMEGSGLPPIVWMHLYRGKAPGTGGRRQKPIKNGQNSRSEPRRRVSRRRKRRARRPFLASRSRPKKCLAPRAAAPRAAGTTTIHFVVVGHQKLGMEGAPQAGGRMQVGAHGSQWTITKVPQILVEQSFTGAAREGQDWQL